MWSAQCESRALYGKESRWPAWNLLVRCFGFPPSLSAFFPTSLSFEAHTTFLVSSKVSSSLNAPVNSLGSGGAVNILVGWEALCDSPVLVDCRLHL